MLPRVVAAHRVVALVVAVVCLPAPRAAPLPPAARAAWAPTPPLVRADESVCALVRSGRSQGQFVHCRARSGRRAVPLDVAPDARGKGSPPWLCGSDRTGPVERRAVLAHATQRWAAAAFLFEQRERRQRGPNPSDPTLKHHQSMQMFASLVLLDFLKALHTYPTVEPCTHPSHYRIWPRASRGRKL